LLIALLFFFVTHHRLRDSKFGDPGTGGRFTAHKTMTQMEEIEETPEELAAKIKALAGMIRDSKHCVFFTGAGISTSAGIPDFRGPEGVWTLKATGEKRKGKTVSMLSAVPTTTHMAMVKLHDEGRMHYLISQNVDGIHRKSGIHPHRLSELHGNSNLEVRRAIRLQHSALAHKVLETYVLLCHAGVLLVRQGVHEGL
jgi:hypothetical protein